MFAALLKQNVCGEIRFLDDGHHFEVVILVGCLASLDTVPNHMCADTDARNSKRSMSVTTADGPLMLSALKLTKTTR